MKLAWKAFRLWAVDLLKYRLLLLASIAGVLICIHSQGASVAASLRYITQTVSATSLSSSMHSNYSNQTYTSVQETHDETVMLASNITILNAPLPGTRYVATSGDDNGGTNDCTDSAAPCATVQQAVDQANNGQEIRVATGTYTGTGALTNPVVTIGKVITMTGGFTITNWITPEYDLNLTFLSGDDDNNGTPDRQVGFIQSGANATIRGFTIHRGANTVGFSAGIDVNGGATLWLEDSSVVENNASTGQGGGLYLNGGSTTTLVNVHVDNNEADFGGGIRSAGTLTMTGGTISDNKSTGISGGAISSDLGTITLIGVEIANNTAHDFGGGIYALGTLILTDTNILSNTAQNISSFVGGGGGIYSSGSVSISGGVIQGNRSLTSTKGKGGGISLSGNGELSLTNAILIGNIAESDGGGIANDSSEPVTIIGSIIVNNQSSVNGGGVRKSNAGLLTIIASYIAGNTATGAGGGIGHSQGTLTLESSVVRDNQALLGGGGLLASNDFNLTNVTVSGNKATNGLGGGISHSNGTATLNQVTISDNLAGLNGGGFYNGATANVVNVTIDGNSTSQDGGGFYNNGAGKANLQHVTISSNAALVSGGGLFNDSDAASVVLHNTILSNTNNCAFGNSATAGVTANDHNLETANSCGFSGTDLVNADPRLGPLRDNGGATFTRALLTGSDALNTGMSNVTVDQRGFPRPVDGQPDIGAYERGLAADVAISKFESADPVLVNTSLTYFLLITNTSTTERATGVLVTDTLPVGVELGAVTTTQGTCSGTATVVCDLGTLDSNRAVVVTIAVTPTLAPIS